MIKCDVAAVVVTLGDTPRLHQAISSVRSSVTHLNVSVICVINDPSATGTWQRDGVHYVGAGLNLGWAGGLHAGLIGVDSKYVWAIQDDMIVDPHTLNNLIKVLDNDQNLASVRPLNVDAGGFVAAGQQGNLANGHGRFVTRMPQQATPFRDLTPIDEEGYLPSSGQLIRREVWDAVGGFDPWFYPWGHIDVDFAQTLRATGWQFRTVLDAHMTHKGQTSTTSNFRSLCMVRHDYLYESKWDLDNFVDLQDVPPVSPWIVEASRQGGAKPRETDLETLRNVTAVAAADLARWIPIAVSEELTYLALRQFLVDPSIRRGVGKRAYSALRRKLPSKGGR